MYQWFAATRVRGWTGGRAGERYIINLSVKLNGTEIEDDKDEEQAQAGTGAGARGKS